MTINIINQNNPIQANVANNGVQSTNSKHTDLFDMLFGWLVTLFAYIFGSSSSIEPSRATNLTREQPEAQAQFPAQRRGKKKAQAVAKKNEIAPKATSSTISQSEPKFIDTRKQALCYAKNSANEIERMIQELRTSDVDKKKLKNFEKRGVELVTWMNQVNIDSVEKKLVDPLNTFHFEILKHRIEKLLEKDFTQKSIDRGYALINSATHFIENLDSNSKIAKNLNSLILRLESQIQNVENRITDEQFTQALKGLADINNEISTYNTKHDFKLAYEILGSYLDLVTRGNHPNIDTLKNRVGDLQIKLDRAYESSNV